MRSTLRTTSAAALAASLALGALGTAPAGAAIDDVIPTPPTPPVPLTFAVADAQVVEGDPGDSNVLAFEVTASRSNWQDVTFHAQTGNLGFEATPGVDFTPVDEIVTMPAGATSFTIEVPVVGDLDVEEDAEGAYELVILFLGDPSSGTVTDGTALGRIDDDDTADDPTIHIEQLTQLEGTGGTTEFSFTVWLSHASDQPVSLDLSVAPGSATSPADYQASPAMVVFAPGETKKEYVVSVVADAIAEADEEFVVEMSNASGGTIVGGGGLGTILDDDASIAGPGGFTSRPSDPTPGQSFPHLQALIRFLSQL